MKKLFRLHANTCRKLCLSIKAASLKSCMHTTRKAKQNIPRAAEGDNLRHSFYTTIHTTINTTITIVNHLLLLILNAEKRYNTRDSRKQLAYIFARFCSGDLIRIPPSPPYKKALKHKGFKAFSCAQECPFTTIFTTTSEKSLFFMVVSSKNRIKKQAFQPAKRDHFTLWMNASILAALSRRIFSVTWAYISPVVPILECPRAFDTVFKSSPLSREIEAKV